MARTYGARDRARGREATVAWLTEELGELAASKASREDLEELLRRYWSPVYAFLRRRGWSRAEAEDLTQEFLADVVLQRDLIGRADRERGRFRTFLLAALRHFAIDARRRRAAREPPGGTALLPEDPEEIRAAVAGGHLEWLEHDIERARLRAAWASWFETHDVLLCPVMLAPALPHDHSPDMNARTCVIDGEVVPYWDNIRWTGLIGVVGLPSAVAPIGRTADGLPVGIQVVTPFLRDRDAIHVAGLLADLVGGGYAVPPGFEP